MLYKCYIKNFNIWRFFKVTQNYFGSKSFIAVTPCLSCIANMKYLLCSGKMLGFKYDKYI